MWRFVKLAVMALCLLASSPCRAEESLYLDLVEQADTALEQKDWSAALDLIDRAMLAEPDNPANVMLLSNKGIVLFNLGSDSLAVATLTMAHHLAPRSVTVLNNRARVYAASGHPVEAFRDFSAVLDLDSMLVEPRFYRAMLAMSFDDLVTAVSDFDFLGQAYPERVETHLGHAAFYSLIDEPDLAIKEYTWLIEHEPSAMYYTERAALYLALDELTEASLDIAEGLRLNPDDPELYLQRAVLNRKRYRPADARADVARARALGVSQARLRALGLDK